MAFRIRSLPRGAIQGLAGSSLNHGRELCFGLHEITESSLHGKGLRGDEIEIENPQREVEDNDRGHHQQKLLGEAALHGRSVECCGPWTTLCESFPTTQPALPILARNRASKSKLGSSAREFEPRRAWTVQRWRSGRPPTLIRSRRGPALRVGVV